MRFAKLIALMLTSLFAVPNLAQEIFPVSGVLNSDFADEIAIVSTLSSENEEGIFIYNPEGELILGLAREEIIAVSNEAMGGFLIAYDESGQALFELPNGAYQMQLTTSNGSLNFNYLNRHSSVQDGEFLSLDEDILLQETEDSNYQIYLLQSGELAVLIHPEASVLTYQIRFTGIPALNIHYEILTLEATS